MIPGTPEYAAHLAATRDTLAALPVTARRRAAERLVLLDDLHCRSGSAAYHATLKALAALGLAGANRITHADRAAVASGAKGTPP